MTREPYAGRCKDGQRHHWEKKETLLHRGAFRSEHSVRCTRCPRVKIIEYTKLGNHVAGYETWEQS